MYKDFQDTATELLEEFGQSVLLVKPDYTGDNQEFDPSTGTYVPVDPNKGIGTGASSNVNAMFVGIKFSWGVLQGSTSFQYSIQEGDSIVLVAADGTRPEQNDVIDGWTILAVEEVKPAATTVFYKCHVRKQ